MKTRTRIFQESPITSSPISANTVVQARSFGLPNQGEQDLSTLNFTKNPGLGVNLAHNNNHKDNNYSQQPIQAKLTVGAPGDKYEKEADQVASQVVNQMNATPSVQAATPSIQRTFPENKKGKEEGQRKPLNDSIQREMPKDQEEIKLKPLNHTIQREIPQDQEEIKRKSSNSPVQANQEVESTIETARGSGQVLDAKIRTPMESAFGADFSQVKVHNDAKSDQLNNSLQARAFTTGKDVFFRQGEYNPGSKDGQELLAHELTHVVQQNGSTVQQKR